LENALYCTAGSIYILKKIQNGVVLVKKQKKKSTGCNRVLPGHWVNLPGRPGHDFFYFFINSVRFHLLVSRVPGRSAGPDRVSKL
jgi:hypothetical protein